MARADLLALTPDAIAALSNRGLVKRAQKEIGEGKGPTLEELDDTTVVGTFSDGVVARLPPGVALGDASCTCGAHGVCRHRVAVALAYADFHAHAAPSPVTSERWSPGEIDDAMLERHLGKRAWDRARALKRRGFVAEVRRATAVDPVPTVVLPTCTVRFLVPRDLGYVHCDAAHGGGELVALAVWAFRAADLKDASADRLELEISPEKSGELSLEAMLPALELAGEVVLDGVVHSRPSQAAQFERARRAASEAKLTWPVVALDELEEQLQAYHARSTRYLPAAVAALIAELFARQRASLASSEVPATRVLGTEEALETRLDHLRLVSLGARISGDGRQRRADVVLADPDTATVFVMRRDWDFGADEPIPSAEQLGNRLFTSRITLAALARGQMVTAAARRRANRLLLIAQSRVARTSVTPSRGDWTHLPEGLRVSDVSALDASLRSRAPGFLRPRVLAESFHVIEVGGVGERAYSPGAQSLECDLTDPNDNPFLIRLTHRAEAPGAIDELARALSGQAGEVRFVSGIVRRAAGAIEVEPLTVVTNELHVLDLAPATHRELPSPGLDAASRSPLATAVHDAAETLRDGAHVGLRHAPASFATRLASTAGQLSSLGLRSTAERVEQTRKALVDAQSSGQHESEQRLVRSWVDAMIRISLCEEAM